MTEEATPAFEHPIAIFPAEHYLIVRELATLAEDEHPPCQSYPDLWWPNKGESSGRAVEICKTRCGMREQCLAYALEANEEDGVWGGTTPAERKAMKKQTDNRQETPLDNPPPFPSPGGPDIPPPPAGQDHPRVQKGTARYCRVRGSEQAPEPAAEHRPQRSRQSV